MTKVKRWEWHTGCGCFIEAADGYVEGEDYDTLAAENAQLRAELDAIKAQQGEAVAWAVANSVDEIGGFAPIYYTEEGAIRWANGKNIIALCAVPPAIDALVEALEWYADKVAGCRKIGTIGQQFCQALDLDGGLRALEAIAAHRASQRKESTCR